MKRILVIDDDANVRDSFMAALESPDYDVSSAASGPAGIESAKAQRPDLVFLDLKMPGMNGVETLMLLRRVYPDVPVYIVTAFYAEFLEPLKELRRDGTAFDLARKPLTVAEIRTIAASALNQHQGGVYVDETGKPRPH
jgi:CheY-like chemotaxis protein